MNNPILVWLGRRWRLLFILLTPLVLLPLPIVSNTSQARCGYIVIIMAAYWISEVIPLPVTSLLAIALFPMAGVLTYEDVAPLFFKDNIALFLGSLSLAYAIETVNLHRRIALFVLSSVGSSKKWSMAGLMGVTAFLSMWINNSAAASIMLPVALGICRELSNHGNETAEQPLAVIGGFESAGANKFEQQGGATRDPNGLELPESQSETLVEVKTHFYAAQRAQTGSNTKEIQKKKSEDLQKGFLLSVAYSASIGGLGTLVGTGPNVLIKGFVEERYGDTEFRINFLNFFLFAFPVSVLMLILSWIWLQIVYNRHELFRFRVDEETRKNQASLKRMLVTQYKELGKAQWSEYSVGIVFVMMVLLWVTKDFSGTPGWDVIFQKDYIGDSTVAVLCGLLPLILPNANPFGKNWRYEPIVQWNNLSKNISWGVLFLLGAGFAIAKAFDESGLSESVANALNFLKGVPQLVVIIIVIVISGLVTEVTSNVSTANIFFPVLDAVAKTSGIHPAYLLLPCTLAVSLAFMLPIATPPNAIVFSSGSIRVIDMIKTGAVMNIIGFVVIFFASATWMPKVFGLDDRATQLLLNMTATATLTTTLPSCG